MKTHRWCEGGYWCCMQLLYQWQPCTLLIQSRPIAGAIQTLALMLYLNAHILAHASMPCIILHLLPAAGGPQISRSIFNELRNATMDENISAAGSDDEQVCVFKGRGNWLVAGLWGRGDFSNQLAARSGGFGALNLAQAGSAVAERQG